MMTMRRGCCQGAGHEGVVGWSDAEDHHDRYADRPSMVHLRHGQGRHASPAPASTGNARVPQGQARRQTSLSPLTTPEKKKETLFRDSRSRILKTSFGMKNFFTNSAAESECD